MSVRKWVEEEVLHALASNNLRPKRFEELHQQTRHKVHSRATLRKCLVHLCVLGVVVEFKKSHKNAEYRLVHPKFIETGSWKTEEPTHLVYEIMEMIMRHETFKSKNERFQVALGFASYFYFRWDLLPAMIAYLPHQYFTPNTQRKFIRRDGPEWIERFFLKKRYFQMVVAFCDKYPRIAAETADFTLGKMSLKEPLSGVYQINSHMVSTAFRLLYEFLRTAHKYELGFRAYGSEAKRLKVSERTLRAAMYKKLKH